MEITKEEWEASDCHNKTRHYEFPSSSQGGTPRYYLCVPCRKRVRDPSHETICDGAPRPRCKSMKEGERTALEIIEEFLNTINPTKNCRMSHIEDTIELFEKSVSRKWLCCDCKHFNHGGDNAFFSTHGSSKVFWCGEINSFCTFFIIRKCFMREPEKKRCYTIMSKLADFLSEQQLISIPERKELRKALRNCRAIDADKIHSALQKLYESKYWESLEPQQKSQEHANKKRKKTSTSTSRKQDDCSDSMDPFSHQIFKGFLPPQYFTYCRPYGYFDKKVTDKHQLPMKVVKVTDEGWVFQHPRSGYSSDSSQYDANISKEELLVRLPTQVAKLGCAGMTISCLSLGRRHGIWSPFNTFDDSSVFANIYPPE